MMDITPPTTEQRAKLARHLNRGGHFFGYDCLIDTATWKPRGELGTGGRYSPGTAAIGYRYEKDWTAARVEHALNASYFRTPCYCDDCREEWV